MSTQAWPLPLSLTFLIKVTKFLFINHGFNTHSLTTVTRHLKLTVQLTTPYFFNPPSLCKITKISHFLMQHARIPLQTKYHLWNLTLRRKLATKLTKLLFFLTGEHNRVRKHALAAADTPRDRATLL